MKNILNKVMHSYHTIIIILILISFISIMYTNKILKETKVYTFDGKSDYVEINNGVISINHDINLFEGSNIKYLKEDVILKEYDVGYYIIINDEYVPIASSAGTSNEGFSLKAIIEGKDNFKVVEPSSNNYYFTKEKIKKLDDKLYFVIKGIDLKDNEIKDVFEVNLNKVSRN